MADRPGEEWAKPAGPPIYHAQVATHWREGEPSFLCIYDPSGRADAEAEYMKRTKRDDPAVDSVDVEVESNGG